MVKGVIRQKEEVSWAWKHKSTEAIASLLTLRGSDKVPDTQ